MKWSHKTGALVSSPAVVNGVVYIGSNDNNVYALNATPARSYGATPPADRLFLTRNRQWLGICRLLRHQGLCSEREHWHETVELLPADSSNILACCREWGGLCRFSGLRRLRATSPHRCQALEILPMVVGYSSPAVANGVVYVGSLDQNVYALDASTGANCGATHRGPCRLPRP